MRLAISDIVGIGFFLSVKIIRLAPFASLWPPRSQDKNQSPV